MAWTAYKGLQVPDTTSGDAGTNLSDDLKALADRTSGTAGSVVFVGASGFATEDNANLFFDDTNNRLGIGTAAPGSPLHIQATTPQIQLKDTPSGRILQITGPTGTQAAIELFATGAGLRIATSPINGGSIIFETIGVARVQITNGTTLAVNGSLSTAVASKTAAYTLTATDSVIRADASGGAFTVTLPTAVGCTGARIPGKEDRLIW